MGIWNRLTLGIGDVNGEDASGGDFFVGGREVGGESDRSFIGGETTPGDRDSDFFVVIRRCVCGSKCVKRIIKVNNSGGDGIVESVSDENFGLGNNTGRNAINSTDLIVT